MELTSLKYFVTVAHELHFRRAAVILNMTQGPLSAAIKKLEDELGTALFERSSRSVKLTEAGRFFLPEAEAVLERSALALERLEQMLNGSGGRLAVGYNEPALNTFLPELLSGCRRSFPGIRLELREMEALEQLHALREGQLDIGFMRPYGFDLAGLCVKPVFSEDYKLVLPQDHELVSRDEITLSDLSGRELILFSREVNPGLFDLLCGRLSTADLPPPRFRQDARNKSSVLAMVKAGFGAAILPESCLQGNTAGIEVRKLAADLPHVEIMAVWKEGNTSPLQEKMLEWARTASGNCRSF